MFICIAVKLCNLSVAMRRKPLVFFYSALSAPPTMLWA
ncbi:hypothetical protein RHECNPAF_6420083 [Rhizobium etli CNPAF512]|nr:hypothetical protein RHECNPAF_6420083 [Rhizobium etli CNPAF512]